MRTGRVGKIACSDLARGNTRAFTPVFAVYSAHAILPTPMDRAARLCPPYGSIEVRA